MNRDEHSWSSEPTTTPYLPWLLLCVTASLIYYNHKTIKNQSTPPPPQNTTNTPTTPTTPLTIPTAPNAIPILGHALQYRQNPPKFLSKTIQQCGPIFILNLAGKRMILACGAQLQKQLATLPESTLSLRKAVVLMGFEESLGVKNVHRGANVHRGVVRKLFAAGGGGGGGRVGEGAVVDRLLVMWRDSIRGAMEIELRGGGSCDSNASSVVDFLDFTRRVMLRATIEVFIGQAFLRDWTGYDFLEEFMGFQDTLEDVTAKAVVLPRPLVLVTMLWPLQRRREHMQRIIFRRLQTMNLTDAKNNDDDDDENHHHNNNDTGVWLQEVLSKKIPLADISEYIIGLLFAGHKNPAIGAAQTYLLLLEHGSETALAKCRTEAAELLSSSSSSSSKSGDTPTSQQHPTLRKACLETLRLTAHTIGGLRTAQTDLTVTVTIPKQPSDDDDDAVTTNNTTNNVIHYTIPNGSSIGFPHITTSLDTTTIWGPNAQSFDSHLQTHPQTAYADDYSFTTFSQGVHKCPGQDMAMMQLMTYVAVLLHEYDVGFPNCTSSSSLLLPPLDFERATLAQRAGPVVVSIGCRKR